MEVCFAVRVASKRSDRVLCGRPSNRPWNGIEVDVVEEEPRGCGDSPKEEPGGWMKEG